MAFPIFIPILLDFHSGHQIQVFINTLYSQHPMKFACLICLLSSSLLLEASCGEPIPATNYDLTGNFYQLQPNSNQGTAYQGLSPFDPNFRQRLESIIRNNFEQRAQTNLEANKFARSNLPGVGVNLGGSFPFSSPNSAFIESGANLRSNLPFDGSSFAGFGSNFPFGSGTNFPFARTKDESNFVDPKNVVFGKSLLVRGQDNLVFGNSDSVFGNSNLVTGGGNIIVGNSNKIVGDGNLINGNLGQVTGNNNLVKGDENVIFGNQNVVNGKNNLNIGNQNTMDGASNLAIGNRINVLGNEKVVINGD